MSDPLFNKIALIGIGLIGGSIALEARKRGLAKTIVAWEIGSFPQVLQWLEGGSGVS